MSREGPHLFRLSVTALAVKNKIFRLRAALRSNLFVCERQSVVQVPGKCLPSVSLMGRLAAQCMSEVATVYIQVFAVNTADSLAGSLTVDLCF